MDLKSFTGKVVRLTFRRPAEIEGAKALILIHSVIGSFGGTANELFTLNDVREAIGQDGTDVADTAGLRGKPFMGSTRNIQSVEQL